MLNEEIHLYCMPGLAANSKIFEFIRLPKPFVIHKLEWIDPLPNESIQSFSKRMCEKIKKKNPILLGVSFGGILVQEMSKIIPCHKVIIISSVKSYKEFPVHIMLGRRSKAYKYFPTQWIDKTEDFIGFVFGPSMRKRMGLYKHYLSFRSKEYLQWALHHFFQWDQKEADPKVIHIHGTHDALIPVFNIKNYIAVKGGTHAMILRKAHLLNEILPEIILKNTSTKSL
ncbi:MAG: alpha/beta hydrolase [Flavobacteriaceae bacterium]|jgi:pimeloyl-ACP methyl ester carboxylesterase|nr:alpha/beta hydrolase [Flavobacteriaceae bacterium]